MNAVGLNALYAAAQTIIIVAYAVVFVVDPTPPLTTAPAIRAAGLVLCVAGLLLGVLAFATLRSVIQIAPQPREGGHLVTSGVYGWFRHPIYTGIVAIMIGLWLRKPTIIVAIVTLAVLIVIVLKSTYEERLLAERYPDYPAYKRRAFGVIPLIT